MNLLIYVWDLICYTQKLLKLLNCLMFQVLIGEVAKKIKCYKEYMVQLLIVKKN